ncbi:14652_t:CDS:2, partial [Cetraspora pellucida]
MPYITEVMIFCLVLGDAVGSAFVVDIKEDQTISHLKKLIKEEKKNAFGNIDANDIMLWKVDGIPISRENLKTKIRADINIEQELGGMMLPPSNTIKQCFRELTNDIQIIIQPPTTTGKRKEGSDEEDENQGKKRRYEYPTESEEGRDSLMIISGERLKTISDFVENNHIGLLRSPPSSGKSTLGQVLRDYFDSLNYDSIYISLAGINGKQAIYDEELFENFWKEKVGRTWTEISKRKEATYVFIDEIQVIYGNGAPFFWGRVKELLSSEEYKHKSNPQNLRMLLLGTYHPTLDPQMTPVEFHHALGLNVLLLKWEEFQHLVKNYIQLHITQGSPLFKIPEEVQKAVFNLTGGHPGLCRFILRTLRSHFREYEKEITVKMLRFLASTNLRDSIITTARAFYWFNDWNPTIEESEFIRKKLFA